VLNHPAWFNYYIRDIKKSRLIYYLISICYAIIAKLSRYAELAYFMPNNIGMSTFMLDNDKSRKLFHFPVWRPGNPQKHWMPDEELRA
jgi:hypothetical protein